MTTLLKQYFIITGTYWAFTITDGALRMLVILYFHGLGYSAFEIAMLFLFYEFFGVVTNLVGGWLGAHLGLNKTMQIGLALQILALAMLTVADSLLSVPYVMLAQALSGIAKDLNKMSAKSSIKLLMPEQNQQGKLYKWVAILTGSKNTLKGAGFFIGAALLTGFGFQQSMLIMLLALSLTLFLSITLLHRDLGKAKSKPKFKHIFSKSHAINTLSLARMFLFGARDIWFVIALPVYLQQVLNWSNTQVGSFMAIWIIAYGIVQAIAPAITNNKKSQVPDGKTALFWSMLLTMIPVLIAWQMNNPVFDNFINNTKINNTEIVIVLGLMLFGAIFAINSSLHSFLILKYSRGDRVSLDVGFYYMANAMGRLLGTILSGLLFQWYGLELCLIFSSVFLLMTTIISFRLPRN
ncbi:MAG: organoarsenical effux MFS transporter ArsJ [Pseudomonadota bacterium]